ncbi:MAG TPA: hypothetical protein VGP72_29250 [Planctomycetota bacterium]|jgi:hypothetical protein
MGISGEVVFQRVFDLGGTLNMKKARTLLAEMAETGAVTPKRAAPEYVSFAAPIPLNLGSLNLDLRTEDGAPIGLSARLYEVGALGLMLRFPARVEQLSELARFQNLSVLYKGQAQKRAQIFTMLYDAIKPRIKPAFDEVFDVPIEAESYIAFCLTETPEGAGRLLQLERAQIAALLTSEPHPEKLSEMEIEDTLRNWSSYYRDDLVIADWDAGLLVEPGGQYEDLLYIFEVANLQLLELRKYDLYLDATLDRGYDEYERLSKGPPIFTGRAREVVSELSAVRMDLAEVTDEIANTAKFFGDWYIARVYMGLAGKLHVSDYHKTVEEKLATLDDLYKSVLQEMDRRQNLFLETAIVLLIVFEVAMALLKSH